MLVKGATSIVYCEETLKNIGEIYQYQVTAKLNKT